MAKLNKRPQLPRMSVVITPDSVTLEQTVHCCPHCGKQSPIIRTYTTKDHLNQSLQTKLKSPSQMVIKFSSHIEHLLHATSPKKVDTQEQMHGILQPLQDTLTSG